MGESATKASIVLVVEDEAQLRKFMIRGLEDLPNTEFIGAGTVASAKELLRELKPNLVISDIDLPDGLGIELVAAADGARLSMPFVFVSGFLGDHGWQIPSRANIEVREKPVPLEDLRELVSKHLASPEATTPERQEEEESPFSAVDLLQLACMANHSVSLGFFSKDKPYGEIQILKGRVIAARDRGGAGERAFRRLLFSKKLETRCTKLTKATSEPNISRSWSDLLLDAARTSDEKAKPEEKKGKSKTAKSKSKAGKEKSEKEKSEKSKSDKEKAEKEKSEKSKSDKEKAEKEKSEKSKSDKEKAEKEKSEKSKSGKEKAEKEKSEKSKLDKEKAEKEKSEKSKSDKEKAEKEKSEKSKLDKEKAEKQKSDREAEAEAEKAAKAKAEAQNKVSAVEAAVEAAVVAAPSAPILEPEEVTLEELSAEEITTEDVLVDDLSEEVSPDDVINESLEENDWGSMLDDDAPKNPLPGLPPAPPAPSTPTRLTAIAELTQKIESIPEVRSAAVGEAARILAPLGDVVDEATSSLQQACEELGLGDLEHWSIGGVGLSLYSSEMSPPFIVTADGVKKTEATMKKILDAVKDS